MCRSIATCLSLRNFPKNLSFFEFALHLKQRSMSCLVLKQCHCFSFLSHMTHVRVNTEAWTHRQALWIQLPLMPLSLAKWWRFPFLCDALVLQMSQWKNHSNCMNFAFHRIAFVKVRLEYEGNQQLVRLTVRTQHGEESWMARGQAPDFMLTSWVRFLHLVESLVTFLSLRWHWSQPEQRCLFKSLHIGGHI